MKKMLVHKRLWLLLPVLLLAEWAGAQIAVSGRVIDTLDNSPLIGVTIREKDGTAGAVTNYEGNYTISISNANATLVFSYTGYATREVPVAGRTQVNLTMGEDLTTLQELVVVGYGVQRKSDLTGSVGTVKSKDIERVPTSSIEQAMQGKVAGVYVTPASGQPGAGAVIRIRGTGTLNNSNPLFVVDGMLLDDASFINPQDVQSIEILKDASATAIYGNRGANGVVIITTKRGKAGEKAVIQFSSYYGTQALTKKIPMANAAEYAQLYNELPLPDVFANPASLGAGTDWQDVVFRDAPIANVQLSASGGSDKFLYNVSANYFDQTGILKDSRYDRLTFRVNNEYKLNPYVKLGNNLSFSNVNSQNPPGVIGSALRMPPVFGERDSLGNFSDPTFFGTAIANPAADLFYKDRNFSKGNRLVGTVYADITLFKHFTFRSNFGLDQAYINTKNYEPKFEVSISQRNGEDRLSVGSVQRRTWLWENTLTYDQTWENHHVNVLAGYTSQEFGDEAFGASRAQFGSGQDELLYLNYGNDTTQLNSGEASQWAMISYLARANYTLMDRYLLTASMRVDGSSRFAADNRYGYFPSFALGWNVAEENFMSHQRFIDRLKLRASWGIVGNDKTQLYASLGAIQGGLYSIFGTDESLNQGATLTRLSNPNVRWENASQTDIGMEIGVLNGRLTAEIDWYNRVTSDILAELPIPDYVGSDGNPVVNSAKVRNRGWDFTLNWRETRGKFTYNITGILSTVDNEVLALSRGREEIFEATTPQGDFATRTVVGQDIGSFYGYQVAGVFQNTEELSSLPKLGGEQPGDLRFADLNGRDSLGNLTGKPDGKITADDRTFLGSPIPKINYGFSVGVEAFGLDLAADFFGVSGNKVLNAKALARYGTYNWEKFFYDGRWTGEGTSNTNPRITDGGHNYRMSDYWIKDGSFLRLRTLVLGYTLPRDWTTSIGVSRARFYASGTNLWTKQSYSGYSPEFAGDNVYRVGIDNGSYPIAKTILFGLDVSF
ncbi:MAG TPA: TonB-dependent receptor [Saprospiraceae bacterium]|nr:TonB-dependent receptor [Saprospiraceae bacterium]HPI04755.1 TonB-dependent receptor [Saprospiraceae bacterium]